MSDDLAPLEEIPQEEKKKSLPLLVRQRYDHRRRLFGICLGFCGLCYVFCLVYLVLLLWSETFLDLFVHSRHIALLGAVLFLTPSFILGKILKPIFGDAKPDDEQTGAPLEALTKNF